MNCPSTSSGRTGLRLLCDFPVGRMRLPCMTVEFVLKLLGAGYTAADVVREYPILGPEDVYECATFGAGASPTTPA